jgi:hypothetical protein
MLRLRGLLQAIEGQYSLQDYVGFRNDGLYIFAASLDT